MIKIATFLSSKQTNIKQKKVVKIDFAQLSNQRKRDNVLSYHHQVSKINYNWRVSNQIKAQISTFLTFQISLKTTIHCSFLLLSHKNQISPTNNMENKICIKCPFIQTSTHIHISTHTQNNKCVFSVVIFSKPRHQKWITLWSFISIIPHLLRTNSFYYRNIMSISISKMSIEICSFCSPLCTVSLLTGKSDDVAAKYNNKNTKFLSAINDKFQL